MGLFDMFSAEEKDSLFDQLKSEFPAVSTDAIEMAVTFGRVVGRRNVRQEALLSRFNLTAGRFSILMLLHRAVSQALSPTELAKAVNVTRATITQFLDALERDALVERVDDPNDRRAMKIVLTKSGRALLSEVLKVHLEQLTIITKILTRAERKQFLAIIEKIENALPKAEATE